MTIGRKAVSAALILLCSWAGPRAASSQGVAEGPMRCGDQMDALNAELKHWKNQLNAVASGLPQVVATANSLSSMYQSNSADGAPMAVGYFSTMATTLAPLSSGTGPVIEAINSSMQCMYNQGYMRVNHCFEIPLSCLDEAGLKKRVAKIIDPITAARKDLSARKAALTGQLPIDICYLNPDKKVWWQRPLENHRPCSSGSPVCTYTQCSVNQVICRQHLSYAIDTVGQALDQILNVQ